LSDDAPTHATLVARFSAGRWRGVLVRGPSGAGKSALALALIYRGWRLVADDRVVIWATGERVWGRAPDTLAGLLEVRGVGVTARPALPFVEIAAVIDATPADMVERIPEPAAAIVRGVALPVCRLDLGATSAADKVAAFCDALRL
jgi:serine kinase of HPr protein (carbohydrate metabolism regulator)